MATQYTDNEPFIVDETILSKICWEEYDKHRRDFDYDNLIKVIKFLKSGKAKHVRSSYSESITYALMELNIPEDQWTVIRSETSKYFKTLKHTHPLDACYWVVQVLEKTREIFLFHPATLSRSESLYHKRGFDLGSVSVEDRPCRHKRIYDLHRSKCAEITYRILSGKL